MNPDPLDPLESHRWLTWHAHHIARAEAAAAAEEAAAEQRRADLKDAADMRLRQARMSGEPIPTVGDILAAEAARTDGPSYDPLAPIGSESNPEWRIDGRVMNRPPDPPKRPGTVRCPRPRGPQRPGRLHARATPPLRRTTAQREAIRRDTRQQGYAEISR